MGIHELNAAEEEGILINWINGGEPRRYFTRKRRLRDGSIMVNNGKYKEGEEIFDAKQRHLADALSQKELKKTLQNKMFSPISNK